VWALPSYGCFSGCRVFALSTYVIKFIDKCWSGEYQEDGRNSIRTIFTIYTLCQIKITLIKSRRMKWEIPVACVGEIGTAYDALANKPERRPSGRCMH
jgi:hypothetical protein